ncbi:MAG TPA: 4-alpha-glucanotransferase [Acholeplasmataceae bacterium]|nr:4-alpha-glucanotransferase [Acholeplasmataceae bacterium]
MRETGILLHVSSLPSKYGIGTFGEAAYRFVDFLENTKQTYWQILPLGPTSFGDSPYQTFSLFATNPYFIDLDILVAENLLKQDEIISSDKNNNEVDYNALYNERFKVLRKAFNRFNDSDEYYQTFLKEQESWIYNYSFFMALKDKYDGVSWMYWPIEVRQREEETLKALENELVEDIKFHLFIQFKAYQQYFNLKKYANDKGIKIIGDIPIYVAYDSSDVWVNANLFQLDSEKIPEYVAGVPPDNFTSDGQLWGNPLYDWDEHEKENFAWWVNRIKVQIKFFDMLRIDHFIGFENYYSIPFKDETARNGKWKKGPGIKLFNQIKNELGELNIIAEDLGLITDDVRALLKATGFPGMKLLQFGFDSREESDYIPHNYEENTIAYTGTHDNETTRQWISNLNEADRKYCLDYINCTKEGTEVISMIKATLATKSKIAIIPMQDYLDLGAFARFNVPSTIGQNWKWRLDKNYLTKELNDLVRRLTKLYGRSRK